MENTEQTEASLRNFVSWQGKKKVFFFTEKIEKNWTNKIVVNKTTFNLLKAYSFLSSSFRLLVLWHASNMGILLVGLVSTPESF